MASKSLFSAARTHLLLTVLTSAACLGAGEVSGAQLTASWNDNSNGTAVTRLERRGGGDVAFVALADVASGVTAYVDRSVGPSTTYCYRAMAYDAAGVSPYTTEACAISGDDGYVLSVTVTKAGNGTGTVTSNPAGILCGTTCSQSYHTGGSVTLTATPAAGSRFTGWSGNGCAGTGDCILAGNTAVSVTATFTVAAETLVDFDGDGQADILWRHTSGTLALWLMDGTMVDTGTVFGSVANEWTVAGIGDFNGDGKADILWRHTSGTLSMWLLDGSTLISHGLVGVVSNEWTIADVGDFNGDGKTDILWRHTSGALTVWLLDGLTLIRMGMLGTVPSAWAVVGVGDVNGDGKADILWRHTSGTVAVWFLDGTTVIGSATIRDQPTDWTVAGVGDFNGDGKVDILWRHTSGTPAVWLLNGSGVIGTGMLPNVAREWTVAQVSDFNGDGKADILWRHTSGTLSMWLMNGTTVIGSGMPGTTALAWQIQ